MKILIYELILVLNLISFKGVSQCNVKTNNRSDGVTIKYLNPEFVGTGNGCEFGVSISTNGADYYFNTTVRYSSASTKSIGTLMIGLNNNQSLNLKLYTSELATVKNSELAIGIYLLTQSDIVKLKQASIEKIIFKESNGRNQIVILSRNLDVASRHINCLE
jgi:hypothetical protein